MTKIKILFNFVISRLFRLVPYSTILTSSYKAFTIQEKLNLRVPYSNLDLINYLIKFSSEEKNINIFEYGSGSSTLFFEDYFNEVYSVEHDSLWYQVINKNIKTAKVKLIPPKKTKFPKIKSRKIGYKNLDFSDYVNYIKSLDMKFDIIFIDGRARQDCLLIAMDYINPNGIIILDDSSRSRYKKVIKQLPKNKNVVYFHGFGTFTPLPHSSAIIFNI
jgi:predicted O-methyltransferase YrrM